MRNLLTPALTFLLTFLVNTLLASSVCPPYFSGSIPGNACSREYSTCVNGIHQSSICDESFVFYKTACIPISDSPECVVETEGPSTISEFDCSTKVDGAYSISSCGNEFIQCVAGIAYPMSCPENLVFDEKNRQCLYSCDGLVESEESASTADYSHNADLSAEHVENADAVASSTEEPITTSSTSESIENENDLFDCSNLEDGNYAQGCSSFFYICANKISYLSHCPSGLVYNPTQRSCDYECTSTSTTRSEKLSPTTPVTTSTTTAYKTNFDTTTTAPESSSVQQYEEATTEPVNYITTDSNHYTTTDSPELISATTESVETASQVQVCNNGQISTFGQCASRFTKCVNNTIKTKQCPINTLFESTLLLCVYDLPQCEPVSTVPLQVVPQPDILVSPFDDADPILAWKQKYSPQPAAIENPFYIPQSSHNRHHSTQKHRKYRRRDWYDNRPLINTPFSTSFRGRALLDDSFKDYRRSNPGRINYGFTRPANIKKHFAVLDSFDGVDAPFVSNVEKIFPRVHSSRRLGPREYPEDFEDGSGFGPSELFGSTRNKRSAAYGPLPNHQQGYVNSVSVARKNKVRSSCQKYTSPIFLLFGNCLSEFIYCSGTGINRYAACPVGEFFDKAIGACSETCGLNNPTPTHYESTTIVSDVTNSYSSSNSEEGSTTTQTTTSVSSPSANNDDSTSSVDINAKCSGVANELISLGCSQEYISCSNGVATRHICPAALYFDQSQLLCNYRDIVRECQNEQYKSSTLSPEDDSPLTSSSYSPTVSPYNPAEVAQHSTTKVSVDACHGLPDGSHAEGCSASYIVCADGKLVNTLTCGLGQGFDTSTQLCNKFENIPSYVCDSTQTTTDVSSQLPYTDFDSSISSTTPTTSTSTQSSERIVETTESSDQLYGQEDQETTTTISEYESVQTTTTPLELEEDEEESFEVTTTSAPIRRKDKYCENVLNNKTKALGACRSLYVRCSLGKSIIEYCEEDEVYSKTQSQCVNRLAVAECRPAPNAPTKSHYNGPSSRGDAFCDGKPDGLFRNPGDCAGILQCFGGDVFEYPSCPGRLAFNEATGKCDYPQNVRGCEPAADQHQGECQVHGSFIANPENCSSFFRCVWGQKVLMNCPSGTVFNPSLSVCDWPNAVENCVGNAVSEY